MPVRLKLETFDGIPEPAGVPPADMVTPDTVEDVRLAAYEKGFAAGWDDAVAAQSSDQLRIKDDLARNLADLSFTYQEARTHLLRSLDPLLRGMVEQVLPEIAHATLGTQVVTRLLSEADRLASAPMELAVSPSNRAAIEAALEAHDALPVTLIEEPTLADGQVHFRLGEEERALDMEAVVSAIRGLVSDFLNSAEEGQQIHG